MMEQKTIGIQIDELKLQEEFATQHGGEKRQAKVLMSLWGIEVFSFLEFADADGMPGYGRTIKLQLTEEYIEIWEYTYRDGYFGPVDMWAFDKSTLLSLLPKSEEEVRKIIDYQFYLGNHYDHLKRSDIKTRYRRALPTDYVDFSPCYLVMENDGKYFDDELSDNIRTQGIDIFQFHDSKKVKEFAWKAHEYFFAKRTPTPEYRRKPSRLLPSLNIKNRSVTA